ncbi:hypothetical protein DD235_02385 [Corticimicrobacter populi]|uniref:Uncharacterized protein n=2 Tax=Corticimicrobacter populi TaxID=2175229 RepID=A0A2V1K683_9BURK|nr:hypothetical protein DD235_02385 [Corticimicrobacter populi]
MKGKAPTAEQLRFWDLLASLGCIASRKDGFFDPMVSIHHIDGRTKPNAHWLVLPLSAGNHQDGTGAPGRIAVHPHKARFEDIYGRQINLLRECIQILMDQGCAVPDGALRAAGMVQTDQKGIVASSGDGFCDTERLISTCQLRKEAVLSVNEEISTATGSPHNADRAAEIVS